MIDKLSYEQIEQISNELKTNSDVVEELARQRNIQVLIDFAATVEGYSKFLLNALQINKDADKALEELKQRL